MAIGNAVERGDWVYIYDENGNQSGMVPKGGGPNDGLKGYTSSSVNVRRADWIYSYDQAGNQTSMVPA